MGQTGQQLFESTCAGCHGLDGRGGEHAPNIATSTKLQALSDSGLVHIIHSGIPASGMPAFGSVFKPAQIDAVVSYLRTLQGAQKSALISGDAEAGRTLFFGKARCTECHNINGKGGFLAADLSGYGNTHSADELRQQILNHNKDKRQQWTRVVTRNGREYLGIVRNEDNSSLQFQMPDGDFLFWGKSDLVVVKQEEPSIVLAGDHAKLNPKDLDDLISYLSRTP